MIAYGVPPGTTYDYLEALVASGEPIRVTVVSEIDLPIPDHGDSNPPAPVHLAVQSATELLVHGFKRFHLRMLTRALPEGFKMVVED